MTTLLDISKDLIALQHALDDLEGLPEQQSEELYEWFTELSEEKEAERDRKLDNYAALIGELEARADARKLEAKRMSDHARADENRAKSLKSFLQQFFESHAIKSIETDRYRLTLANNGGKLPVIVDEDFSISAIPDEFTKISITPDLEAIREALEDGEALEFARFGERGRSLRIK